MSRWLHQLAYFVRTAIGGLRATPATTAVTVATIAISLALVGLFVIVVANMASLLERFGERLQLTAYLQDGVGAAEARALARRAAEIDGVESVEFVTKERALERFRARLGDAGLLEGLEDNPLPSSLEIKLRAEHRRPARFGEVVGSLRALPGIEEFGSGQQWVEGYARALAMVRGLGLGLGGVLVLATVLIVANTIRLAVAARRDELEILGLVGARRSFLRSPFLIEGLLEGAAGAGLALVLLFGGFHLVVPAIGPGLTLFFGWSDPRFLSPQEIGLLGGGGALLGLLGAAAALAGEAPS